MTGEKPSVAGTVKVDGYEESVGKNAENAGDFANASAQLVTDGAGFVAGAGMDMASFVLDPVGWLVSNGLNILLELVQPLQDALHFVTGDGPALKTASADFESIGKGFVALADDFVATGDKAVKDCQGDAGEAARHALTDFSVGVKGIGSSAGSVAETTSTTSAGLRWAGPRSAATSSRSRSGRCPGTRSSKGGTSPASWRCSGRWHWRSGTGWPGRPTSPRRRTRLRRPPNPPRPPDGPCQALTQPCSLLHLAR